MNKAIKCIEYLENEFNLDLSHQQKVDLERILTKKDVSKKLLLPVVSVALCGNKEQPVAVWDGDIRKCDA